MSAMTDKDREILRALTRQAEDLNDTIKRVYEDGYEVTLRLEEAKQGYPRVRFALHRKVGPS